MAGVTAAQLSVKISAEGVQQTKDAMQGVSQKADETHAHMSDMLGNMVAFAGAQIGVASVSDALGFLKDQLTDTISAGMEANTTDAQTAAVLKSTHDASGETAASIQALAEHYMGLTGVSKDTVQQTENMLLTFDNISGKSMPAATQAALDMAQALGGDATQQALQLGKALNDPEKGLTALQRVGVTFTTQQKDQIKAMQDSGNMAGAQAVILKELQKEFGGSAEAAGHANGGVKILTAQLQSAREEVGQALIPILVKLLGAVAPLVIAFASSLPGAIHTTVADGQAVIGFFESSSPAADAVKASLILLAGAMAGMAASAIPGLITALVESVPVWITQISLQAAAAVTALAAVAPFLLVGAAIAAVIVIVVLAVQHWGQITAALGRFKDMLGGVAGAIGSFVGGAMSAFGSFLHNLGAEILQLDVQAVTWGENLIKGFVSGILSQIGAAKNAAANVVNGVKSMLGFHSPTEEGPGSDADTWAPSLMHMFAQGLTDGAPDVAQAAAGAMLGVRGALTGNVGGGISPSAAAGLVTPSGVSAQMTQAVVSALGGANAGNRPLQLILDGRVVARGLLPHMAQEIRIATGIRTF